MPNSRHRTRVVILGAAGRDFHNFNAVYREDRSVELITFTAGLTPGLTQFGPKPR